jgi:putative SbcD/Mre11-related phosphoesterase
MLNSKYVFIGKTLFFPKEKILAIGDLHLGYENALKGDTLDMTLNQFEETRKELEKTIQYIKAVYGKIKEIIFLGDLMHRFNNPTTKKEQIKKLLSFLRKYVENENRIIFIRGNHEKDEKNKKYLDYYIVSDIAFIHGNREVLEIYDKTINYIILGHLHPTGIIEDDMKINQEKYKCFMVGMHKKKKFVVVPSFLSITTGIIANEFSDEICRGYDFSIIPQEELKGFEVFVCEEVGEEAKSLGKLSEI